MLDMKPPLTPSLQPIQWAMTTAIGVLVAQHARIERSITWQQTLPLVTVVEMAQSEADHKQKPLQAIL